MYFQIIFVYLQKSVRVDELRSFYPFLGTRTKENEQFPREKGGISPLPCLIV